MENIISLSQTIVKDHDTIIPQTSFIKKRESDEYVCHRYKYPTNLVSNEYYVPSLSEEDVEFINSISDSYIEGIEDEYKEIHKTYFFKTISPIFLIKEYKDLIDTEIKRIFLKANMDSESDAEKEIQKIWFKNFYYSCVDASVRKKITTLKEKKKKFEVNHHNYLNALKIDMVFNVVSKKPYPTCLTPIKLFETTKNILEINEYYINIEHPKEINADPIDDIFNAQSTVHNIFIIFHKVADLNNSQSYIKDYFTNLTTALNGSKKRKLHLVTSEGPFKDLSSRKFFNIILSNTTHKITGICQRRVTYEGTTVKINSKVTCSYIVHTMIYNGINISIMVLQNDVVLHPNDADTYLKSEYLLPNSIGFKRWFILEYTYAYQNENKFEFITQIDDSLDARFLIWKPLCEFTADDNPEMNEARLDTYNNDSFSGVTAFTKYFEFAEDFYLTLKTMEREDIVFIGPTGKLTQRGLRLNSKPYVHRESYEKINIWYKIYSMFPKLLKKKDVHYSPDLGFMAEDAYFNNVCLEERLKQLSAANFMVTYSRVTPKCGTAIIKESWPIEPYIQLIKDGQVNILIDGSKILRKPCPGSIVNYFGKHVKLIIGKKKKKTELDLLGPVGDVPEAFIRMFKKVNDKDNKNNKNNKNNKTNKDVYFTYQEFSKCNEDFTKIVNPYLIRWVIIFWIYLIERATEIEKRFSLRYPILHERALIELLKYINLLQIYFPGSNLNNFNFQSYLMKNVKPTFEENSIKYNKQNQTKYCKFENFVKYLEKDEVPFLCDEFNMKCIQDMNSTSKADIKYDINISTKDDSNDNSALINERSDTSSNESSDNKNNSDEDYVDKRRKRKIVPPKREEKNYENNVLKDPKIQMMMNAIMNRIKEKMDIRDKNKPDNEDDDDNKEYEEKYKHSDKKRYRNRYINDERDNDNESNDIGDDNLKLQKRHKNELTERDELIKKRIMDSIISRTQQKRIKNEDNDDDDNDNKDESDINQHKRDRDSDYVEDKFSRKKNKLREQKNQKWKIGDIVEAEMTDNEDYEDYYNTIHRVQIVSYNTNTRMYRCKLLAWENEYDEWDGKQLHKIRNAEPNNKYKVGDDIQFLWRNRKNQFNQELDGNFNDEGIWVKGKVIDKEKLSVIGIQAQTVHPAIKYLKMKYTRGPFPFYM